MASPFSSDASIDAFGLLGLPARFDVDARTLEAAFFERSKEVHPDRFAQAPAAERVAALSRSRALNDAYQVLKREATRAEYLLAQQGHVIGDNERLDPAMVMELLEQREELQLQRERGNLAEVERLCGAMRTRRREVLDTVKSKFAIAQPDYTAIKQQLILLRYIERYLDECDAALEED
ncbi:MAG: Fe-S protein assembly co-chaperone HscB [Myxococcota bacterium]|nr:Fe-S protein assembly co-chaperone HscB [Myxococcota bacterium]